MTSKRPSFFKAIRTKEFWNVMREDVFSRRGVRIQFYGILTMWFHLIISNPITTLLGVLVMMIGLAVDNLDLQKEKGDKELERFMYELIVDDFTPRGLVDKELLKKKATTRDGSIHFEKVMNTEVAIMALHAKKTADEMLAKVPDKIEKAFKNKK